MNINLFSDKALKTLKNQVIKDQFDYLQIIFSALYAQDIQQPYLNRYPKLSWKLFRIFHLAGQKNKEWEKKARKIFFTCVFSGVFEKITFNEDISIQSSNGDPVCFNSLILQYQKVNNLYEAEQRYSPLALKNFKHVLYCGDFSDSLINCSSLSHLCELYHLMDFYTQQDLSSDVYDFIKKRCKQLPAEQFETLDSDLSLPDDLKNKLLFKAAVHLLNLRQIPFRFSGKKEIQLRIDGLGILQEKNQLSEYLKSIVKEAYIDSEKQITSLGLAQLLDRSTLSLIESFHVRCQLKPAHFEWMRKTFPDLTKVHIHFDLEDLPIYDESKSYCYRKLDEEILWKIVDYRSLFNSKKVCFIISGNPLIICILDEETESKLKRENIKIDCTVIRG